MVKVVLSVGDWETVTMPSLGALSLASMANKSTETPLGEVNSALSAEVSNVMSRSTASPSSMMDAVGMRVGASKGGLVVVKEMLRIAFPLEP